MLKLLSNLFGGADEVIRLARGSDREAFAQWSDQLAGVECGADRIDGDQAPEADRDLAGFQQQLRQGASPWPAACRALSRRSTRSAASSTRPSCRPTSRGTWSN